MNSLVFHALAAAAPAAAPANGRPPWADILSSPMSLVFLLLLIFMYFSWNSKRKQDRQKQRMIDEMKKGDRVQTIGGILGTVVEVRDGEVLVKVDESNNTKIKFSRSAINRVVEEEKTG